MVRMCALVVQSGLFFTLAGCAGAPDEGLEDGYDEPLGEARSGLVGGNAMIPNALNPNALNPNALNPNALNPNALNPNALSPNALTSIQDPGEAGALSRELLRYTVECALSTSQSFSFAWTDSSMQVHNEIYWGLLGIATGWAMGPLSSSGQQMVTACLAARVNWYGVSVVISMRSAQPPLKTWPTNEELADYPAVEGGFWGNLFTQTPYARACYRSSTVDHSRNKQRDCAAGHLNADQTISECGLLDIVGPCDLHCAVLTAKGYYSDCTDPVGGKTDYLITVGLR